MRKKIIKLMAISAVAACSLVVIFVLVFHAARHFIIEDKEALVHSIAHSLLPALLVNDAQQVDTVMTALEIHPGIQNAQLVSFDGASIASYSRVGQSFHPMASSFELASVENDLNQVNVIAPITFDGLIIANLHIVVNLWPTYLLIITWLGFILIVPSVIYVLIKQLRIKLRFEIVGNGGDGDSSDTKEAISAAMRNADVSIEYQPIQRFSDGRIWGMEALVCWRHPSGQTLHVTTSDFVALAEKMDVCLPFDDWLLTTACTQAAAWQQQHGPLFLTLNISGSQFNHPTFAEKVRAICELAQFPYQLLELEVNESLALLHPQQALLCFERFASQGLSVTIDHFGLMRNSMEILGVLPIKKVKLNRQLVKRLGTDQQVAELIQTIVSYALVHDIQVASEGVDQTAQSVNLKKMGCILGQGAHFDHPLAVNDFEVALASQSFNVSVVHAEQFSFSHSTNMSRLILH